MFMFSVRLIGQTWLKNLFSPGGLTIFSTLEWILSKIDMEMGARVPAYELSCMYNSMRSRGLPSSLFRCWHLWNLCSSMEACGEEIFDQRETSVTARNIWDCCVTNEDFIEAVATDLNFCIESCQSDNSGVSMMCAASSTTFFKSN